MREQWLIIWLRHAIHWAGKMCQVNMYIFFAKRRTTFYNNSSQLATTFWFLARFEQHPDVMPQNKFLLPTIVMRATIWTFVMTFCFHDVFKYYGAWECGQFSRNDTCHRLEFCNIRNPILDKGTFSKPIFSSGEGTERMLTPQMLKYARPN